MHCTLKIIEKLDDLLDEAEEYVSCSTQHGDDQDLKSAYIDLARCHYDGYEKLRKCAERCVERKSTSGHPHAEAMREMAAWHFDKFDERAAKVKHKMDQVR